MRLVKQPPPCISDPPWVKIIRDLGVLIRHPQHSIHKSAGESGVARYLIQETALVPRPKLDAFLVAIKDVLFLHYRILTDWSTPDSVLIQLHYQTEQFFISAPPYDPKLELSENDVPAEIWAEWKNWNFSPNFIWACGAHRVKEYAIDPSMCATLDSDDVYRFTTACGQVYYDTWPVGAVLYYKRALVDTTTKAMCELCRG
jgi:hypothetical protein